MPAPQSLTPSVPAFGDQAMVEQLGRTLAAWHGTPFYPRTAIRGVGVDCIQFIFAVLQDLGLVGPIQWPRYSVKGGGPELLELIHTRILAETCLRALDELLLIPGDVLLCARPLHLAIVGPDGDLWQSLHPLGVTHGMVSHMRLDSHTRAYRACHLLSP